MSDFKFACPACGQRILASDDYVGHPINCPACQVAITVPANPSAPPAQPKVARLSVSALTSPQPDTSVPMPLAEEQGSVVFQAHQARRAKKSYTGLIAGVAAVALLGVSAFLGRDWLAAKWKAFHGTSDRRDHRHQPACASAFGTGRGGHLAKHGRNLQRADES